ncbi:enoyl-CoA hydratase [Nostoc sp. 3335mG]|nr:enoyl-CoA hydratase [Nostoc sp. 3335mG]
MPEVLLFDVADGVATLTLNRPEQGNALTPELTGALEAAWKRVADDPAIRCAIIKGAGERHFCTGASVNALRDSGQGALLSNRPHRESNRFSPRQCEVWKPVICLVTGLAASGGLHFVVDSDIVIASENAAFMDSHVSVGAVGALENLGLAKRMSMGGALMMTLLGKAYRMPAARAFQLGLVDVLEPDKAAAEGRAQEFARILCGNSPQAMALSKRAIWSSLETGYSNALDLGWELVKSQWRHPDFKEGPAAFLEKRDPEWDPDPDARS